MKRSQPVEKERGTWLSLWLILIMVHGVFAAFLVWYLRVQQGESSPAWILAILFALAIGRIVGAAAAWFWKKWGLWLYAISVAAGIVVGLVLTRTQLIVFHDVIPLVILGYLIRDKRSYFD
jgi:hypothetical protein